jgi:hypothetical protein
MSSYFKARGQVLRRYQLMDYEYNYLAKDDGNFSKLGKKGLLYILDRDLNKIDRQKILNIIDKYHFNSLDKDDVAILSKYAKETDLFGKLYKHNPEIFTSHSAKVGLVNIGLMDRSEIETFILEISPEYIEEYFEEHGYRKDIFKLILEYDEFALYESGYDDWESALDDVDNENENKILELVNKKAIEDGVDIEDLSLEEAIEELDYSEIMDALNRAMGDAERRDYLDKCYRSIKDGLEEYGVVEKLDDTGATIIVNILDFDIDYDAYYFLCEDDNECIFLYYIDSNDFDKPTLDLPGYADADIDNFNEILKDILYDI